MFKIVPMSDTQVGRMVVLFPLPQETTENKKTIGNLFILEKVLGSILIKRVGGMTMNKLWTVHIRCLLLGTYMNVKKKI